MLRDMVPDDMDRVLSIWLDASIQAHDFVEAAFWESQVESMRHTYLPAAQVSVYEHNGDVVGFYALHEDVLAALFVAPLHQGQGFGTRLLSDAQSKRERLTLTVYQENRASCQFYRAQGFTPGREQCDPHTGHVELTMHYKRPAQAPTK